MINVPLWFQFADTIEETQDRANRDRERDDRHARLRCDLKACLEDDNDQLFLRSILSVYVDKLGFEIAPRTTL